jgi:cellulose synthase/poly-beta-1,6-N-acetylglucosamine synthase-like glycosyltransferase
MEEYPPASIVVAAYNAEETIASCIESLLNTEYPEKEIIIVNDGSTDKTEEIIRKYPVELISQPKLGASAARNAGLKKARHEIVAYTDSDCRVSRYWLKNLVRPFADDEVGAVTGKIIFETDESCTSIIRSLDIEERNRRRKKYTRLANGPNSAFRKQLLLRIGGFNPKWYHAEDTEVSYKIWREGYKIVYEPKAEVKHIPESDWRTFLKKRFRDAKAFTRMLYFHTFQASIKDDFVTLPMKIQPPLFAVIGILSIIVLLGLVATIPVFAVYLWLLALLFGIALNLPFSYRVYKRSGKPSYLLKALALTTLRGFFWAAGLIIGAIEQQPYVLDREI